MLLRLLVCLCAFGAVAAAETLEQAVDRYVDSTDAESRDFVKAAEGDASPWTTLKMGFGATFTDGNSDTVTVSFTGNAVREWGKWKLSLGAAAIYAESSGVQSASEWIFTERLDRKLDDVSSIFQALYLEHDEQEKLRVRMRLTVGYTRRVITKEKFWLEIDLGGGILYEEFRNPDVDDIEGIAQIGIRWEWQITDSLLYKQTIQIYPNLSDGGEFQLLWISELSTPVSDRWVLVLTLIDTYDSKPPVGLEENDIKVIIALTVDFTKK